ncbi:hypothetical protein MESS2_650039 [Mesorhizobium metallidurans STM 2683]|uniref:Uncharacterized protein n=1 Tax=Mesorhizobium metallidurans STM 2683 TaxID=1297569 RepID=M5ESC6_9HYPH|nr:hypothetical protein MESS2_650039 [Mesorhizobium metallidurans STM 2683]
MASWTANGDGWASYRRYSTLLPVWKEHFAINVARRCPSAQRTCPVSCIFFAAAMEEPEKFAPTLHVAFEEKLPWLKLADGLPTRFGPDYTKE